MTTKFMTNVLVFSLTAFLACEGKSERAARYLSRGTAFADRNEPSQALACYDSALALDPTLEEALVRKGEALASIGRLPAALAAYDGAVALNERNAALHVARGAILTRLESPVEAERAFDRAIALGAQADTVLVVKGWAEHEAERAADAAESFRKAAEANPGNKDAWLGRALLMLEARKPDRRSAALAAQPFLDRALGIDPKDRAVWFLKAAAFRKAERYEEELAAYDSVLALGSAQSSGWYTFRSKLVVKVGEGTLWYNRGAALARLDRREESLASLDSALAHDATDQFAWRLKGDVLTELGRKDEARECYDQAYQQEPGQE